MIEPSSIRVSAVLVVMVLQSDADVDVDVHDCRTRRVEVDTKQPRRSAASVSQIREHLLALEIPVAKPRSSHSTCSSTLQHTSCS